MCWADTIKRTIVDWEQGASAMHAFILTRKLRAVFASGCLLACNVWAQSNIAPGYPERVEGYDRREVAMLPRYCLHTLGFRMARVPGGEDQATTDRWYAFLGPTFNGLHHYCWGMMKTNRAMILARTREGRISYLNSANGEFDYVIQRAPRDFVLLPEIVTKKGENLIHLGRGQVALLVLEEATKIKPDYWPPYARMSDYLKDQGDIARAREVLEKGLAAAPDAQALKRRLAELDQRKDAPAR
jgi:tetratricopeptide (TPR) repeat protein